MALLKMAEVYAYIFKTISEDPVIGEYMDFDENTTMVEKAKRIQKKRKPTLIVGGNFPIISFYTELGMREEANNLVYVTAFNFDVYVQDGYEEVAVDIADRINELFDSQYTGMKQVDGFKSEFLAMAEAPADQEDVFKFFTQILFNLSLKE